MFDEASCLRKMEQLNAVQWFEYDQYGTTDISYTRYNKHLPPTTVTDFSTWWLAQKTWVNAQTNLDNSLSAWKSIFAGSRPSWSVTTFRNIVANWSLKAITKGQRIYEYRVYGGGYVYQEPIMKTKVFNPSLVDPCVFKRTFGMHLQPKQPVKYAGSSGTGITYTYDNVDYNLSPSLIGLRYSPYSANPPSISIGFYYGAGSFIPVAGPYGMDELKFVLGNISANKPNGTIVDMSKMDSVYSNGLLVAPTSPLRYTAKLWYDSWTKQYYPTADYMWDRSQAGNVEFMGKYYSIGDLHGMKIIEKVDYNYVIIEFDDPRLLQ